MGSHITDCTEATFLADNSASLSPSAALSSEISSPSANYDFTSSTGESKVNNANKKIRFHNISIREYDLTLGDNPSVSNGPAISLDWKYRSLGNIDVELYEKHRDGKRYYYSELIINCAERTKILKYTYGFTEKEIDKAIKERNKVQSQRASTVATFSRFSKTASIYDRISRRLKRVAVNNKKEKHHQQQHDNNDSSRSSISAKRSSSSSSVLSSSSSSLPSSSSPSIALHHKFSRYASAPSVMAT